MPGDEGADSRRWQSGATGRDRYQAGRDQNQYRAQGDQVINNYNGPSYHVPRPADSGSPPPGPGMPPGPGGPGGHRQPPAKRLRNSLILAGAGGAVVLAVLVYNLYNLASPSKPPTPKATESATATSGRVQTVARCSAPSPSASPVATLKLQDGAGVNGIAYSPNGDFVATGDTSGTVYVWSTSGGGLTATLLENGGSSSQGINAIAYSPNGSLLAAADQNGFTYVWDLGTGDLAYPALQDLQTDGGVKSVAFSPNGQLLVTGDGNGNVNIWDAGSGSSEGASRDSSFQAITALAFSPDSNILATGDINGNIGLWPTDSMQAPNGTLTQWQVADSQEITGLAFSGNGRMLAASDSGGDTSLWNPGTYGLLRQWPGSGNDAINSVAFITPNGDILAAGDAGGTVHLWFTANGGNAGSFTDPNAQAINAVAVSANGKTLAFGDGYADAFLWDSSSLAAC